MILRQGSPLRRARRIRASFLFAALSVAACSFPDYQFVVPSVDGAAGAAGLASDAGSSAGLAGFGGSDVAGAGESGAADTGGRGAGTGDSGATGSGGFAGAASAARLCADITGLPSDCACADYAAHAYLFCSTARAWLTASSQCAFYDMQLTRIESPAENDWIFQQASAIQVPTSFQNFWIGGSTAAATGTWSWPDGTVFWTGGATGQPVSGVYEDWRPGSPNDSSSGACLYVGSAGWQDTSCSHARASVCEAY